MIGRRIMIVEDDGSVRELIRLYLRNRGFETIEADDGLEALMLFREQRPDLILLDVGIPKMDGLELCRTLRTESAVPIVFISGFGDADNIVEGLRLGADDYITKPFDPNVLVARVEAHLRRSPVYLHTRGGASEQGAQLIYGDLVIDLAQFTIRLAGRKINVSAKEFQLLAFMTKRPDCVFTAEELYRHIWGAESYSDTRTVVVHISSLRKKLEPDPTQPLYVQNVRGYGYKFNSRCEDSG